MNEEIKKAYKLFNREDLIDDGYKKDLNSNIQVFLTTKEMINYMNLQQKVEQLEKENIKQKEIIENLTTMTVCGDKKQIKNTAQYKLEQLENIRKEAIEYIEDKMELTKECPQYLLDILNKGDEDNV